MPLHCIILCAIIQYTTWVYFHFYCFEPKELFFISFPISHLFYPIVLDMFLVLCMAQLVCARGYVLEALLDKFICFFFRLCTAQWVFVRGYVLEALLDIFIFFPDLYGIVGIRPWIWGNGQIVGSVCPQRSIRSGKNSRGSALCWDLFFFGSTFVLLGPCTLLGVCSDFLRDRGQVLFDQ